MTDDELWIKRRRVLKTSEEWQVWEHLYPLMRAIENYGAPTRKLWLFTAASVRHLLGGTHIGANGWIVDPLERLADDRAHATEAGQVATVLREIRLECTAVMGGMYWQASVDYAEQPETDPWRSAWSTAEAVVISLGRRTRLAAGLLDDRPEDEHTRAGEASLCVLVRDIFGNPFRPVSFDPAWRTDTAVALAQQMYDSREFAAMPILADALQDAGCEDEQVLNHCRDANQVHVRGCWVCDLVLGNN